MTASTEHERAEFEKAWRERPIYMGGVHQKEVAYIWWTQAARRAPAVPVPSRRPTLEEIEEAVGYHSSGWDCVDPSELIDAIMNIAAAPRPPEAALVPSIAVTPEMVEAANEAYCPFGDMELALCAALQVAPIPPGAAPVPQGWRDGVLAVADMLKKKADAFADAHGYDDMGGLSFGQGSHADAKLEHHSNLLELEEEVRAMLAAAPQPPEAQASVSNVTLAAPVELPEPVAFALEWMFNGEERGMRLYDDETHCRFDAESDGGVCHPLYTEQQVRQLLAARLKPLTDEQWTKIWADWFDSTQDAEDLIRSIEKAHGITQDNQG